MTKKLEVIAEKCSGCRLCQLMCSLVHQDGSFNPRKGLVRVDINRTPKIGTPLSEIDVPHVCLQCDPAPCAEACPEEAFEWDGRLDLYKINEALCTGCGTCADACPYHMIVIDVDDDHAMKCDLCGGDPVCVQFCPTGALSFV